MISGLSPSIFIEKDTDLDALNYFERLKEAGGGSVTNQRAYHVLFSQLKRYGLFPEEIIPLPCLSR